MRLDRADGDLPGHAPAHRRPARSPGRLQGPRRRTPGRGLGPTAAPDRPPDGRDPGGHDGRLRLPHADAGLQRHERRAGRPAGRSWGRSLGGRNQEVLVEIWRETELATEADQAGPLRASPPRHPRRRPDPPCSAAPIVDCAWWPCWSCSPCSGRPSCCAWATGRSAGPTSWPGPWPPWTRPTRSRRPVLTSSIATATSWRRPLMYDQLVAFPVSIPDELRADVVATLAGILDLDAEEQASVPGQALQARTTQWESLALRLTPEESARVAVAQDEGKLPGIAREPRPARAYKPSTRPHDAGQPPPRLRGRGQRRGCRGRGRLRRAALRRGGASAGRRLPDRAQGRAGTERLADEDVPRRAQRAAAPPHHRQEAPAGGRGDHQPRAHPERGRSP